jgi:hypothetical protein
VLILGQMASHRCMVCAECTTSTMPFWPQSMEFLGDVGQVEARFGPFRDSVNLDAR